MRSQRLSPGRINWAVTVAGVALVTALTVFGPLSDRTWERPELLFSIVTVTAATCVIAATIVIALADRREMAEIGLLGSALMAASVMPLVHGLVTPDVLYDDTAAFRTAAFLSLPIAVVVATPLLWPRSRFGRWAARRWRDWTLLSLLGVFIIASAVVFFPDAITAPGPTEPFTIAVTVVLIVALGSISLRQLRFFELGGRIANLIAAQSIVLLAGAAVLPMIDHAYGAAFWWLHLTGVIGVLGVCGGLVVARHMSRSAQEILGPVLARDPLAAFELGLSPSVHRFVSDLEQKDQMTRDHVIRTGELAIRVGERMRLPASELRNLGLAAMLHDVGKLEIPDDILKKPSRLTSQEYEVIKQHTVLGEEMLRSEPTLAGAADIVRSHHERVDGAGYPDGLRGDEIPLASRIIAACDAFDAMTHDRQYRTAMPVKLAFAILREHSGSQWDAEVVRQVMAALPSMPALPTFDEVGRSVDLRDQLEEAAPVDVSELLATVDAEI